MTATTENNRWAIYARVSTDTQDIDSQTHAIMQWMSTRPVPTSITKYTDLGISGSRDDRPQFQAMLADIAAGRIDTVVVYRLDRLSRTATTALQLLINWIQSGLEFWAVDQPALSASKDDPFRLTKLAMFSELAQIERETTVRRVKAGLAAAKARGVKLGRQHRLTQEQMGELRTLRDQGNTCRQLAKHFGVSVSTAARMAKEAI